MPINGSAVTSGRIVSKNRPIAEQICAIVTDALYPILSTNPADRRSIRSWIIKLIVISSVIFDSGIW